MTSKALQEEYNATLPSQMPLGASVDETQPSYEQLPEKFQRIENGAQTYNHGDESLHQKSTTPPCRAG